MQEEAQLNKLQKGMADFTDFALETNAMPEVLFFRGEFGNGRSILVLLAASGPTAEQFRELREAIDSAEREYGKLARFMPPASPTT